MLRRHDSCYSNTNRGFQTRRIDRLSSSFQHMPKERTALSYVYLATYGRGVSLVVSGGLAVADSSYGGLWYALARDARGAAFFGVRCDSNAIWNMSASCPLTPGEA